MDRVYIKAVIREMHDELIQREKTFRNLIISNKMTREEANHRYICLQNAKWILEADIEGVSPKISSDRLKSRSDVLTELLTEIKFRRKVYGSKVFSGTMHRLEMEKRIGYFEFAYKHLLPPEEPSNIQGELF